jgi:hypothetical protein
LANKNCFIKKVIELGFKQYDQYQKFQQTNIELISPFYLRDTKKFLLTHFSFRGRSPEWVHRTFAGYFSDYPGMATITSPGPF